jgi:hypothetical protein
MLILKLLVFAIPVTFAAILHMVVVKFNLFAWLNHPLDLGKTFRSKRIFGNSKTFRGVVMMVLLSMAGTAVLLWITVWFPGVEKHNILDFQHYSTIFYGLLYGLGYTLAELPNSFAKRQAGIPEGKRGSWLNILIDQADSPIGCLLFLWPFSSMDSTFFIAGALFFLLLHLFFNVTLYLAGLRKQPL